MVYSESNVEYIAPFQSANDFGNIPRLNCWFDAADTSTITYVDNWNELPASKLFFDGTGDFINTTSTNAAYNPTNRIFSAEAWVYFTSNISSRQTLISTYASATTGWSIQLSGGRFCGALTGDGAELVGTTNVQLSTWYHVALAGGPTNYALYVNNNAEATFSGSVTFAGAVSLQLGRYTGTTALLFGFLSNVRVVSGVDVSVNPGITYATNNFPLDNVPNTVFLLDECYPQDDSNLRAALTVNGNVQGFAPNPISEWRDKSGRGIIATQTTTTSQPGLILNRTSTNRNGIGFNGLTNFFNLNAISATTNMLSGAWSSFAVFQRPRTGIENNGLTSSTNANTTTILHASDNILHSSQSNATRTAVAILSTGISVMYADTNSRAYFDNVFYAMTTDWAVTPTNAINSIGRRTTTYNVGDIYELVHVGSALPTYEIQLINQFLNTKWGIY